MNPAFTMQDIERLKTEMEQEGFIACTDEFMSRLKDREESQLDELDAHLVRERQKTDASVDQAVEDNQFSHE